MTLAGALEDARSPLIGWDAGSWPALAENGVKLTGDAESCIDKADGIVDFTDSAGDASTMPRSPPRPARCTSSAPPG